MSSGVAMHASIRCFQDMGRFMSWMVYSLVTYVVHIHICLNMSPKQMVLLAFFLMPPRRHIQWMTHEIHGCVLNHRQDDKEY